MAIKRALPKSGMIPVSRANRRGVRVCVLIAAVIVHSHTPRAEAAARILRNAYAIFHHTYAKGSREALLIPFFSAFTEGPPNMPHVM